MERNVKTLLDVIVTQFIDFLFNGTYCQISSSMQRLTWKTTNKTKKKKPMHKQMMEFLIELLYSWVQTCSICLTENFRCRWELQERCCFFSFFSSFFKKWPNKNKREKCTHADCEYLMVLNSQYACKNQAKKSTYKRVYGAIV